MAFRPNTRPLYRTGFVSFLMCLGLKIAAASKNNGI
nr:MAG TPA: hypothetical protein [Bacteriophage sp.]